MANQSQTKPLLVSLLLTGLLIGGAGWWFTRKTGNESWNSGVREITAADISDVGELLSWGDRSFIQTGSTANNPDRDAGIAAIAAGDNLNGATRLTAALTVNANDPEALIFRNNAQVGDAPYVAIAVVIPAEAVPDASQEILRGVAQAQEAINTRGGIDGRPLKVLIANDSNDPAIATQIAKAIATQADDVNLYGVVGHFSSDVSKAAAAVYQNNGLVMISPTSTAVDLTSIGDFIFRTAPTDAVAAQALARYQIGILNQRPAVMFYNSQSTYSQSLRQAFSQELNINGGNAIAEIDLSQTNNLIAALQQAQQDGAKVLVLFPNNATVDQSLLVLNANRGQLPVLAGDALYAIKTLQAAQAQAENMVLAIPWHLQNNPNTAFATTSRELWGGDVNWRTAMAYDATQALITAIQQNSSQQGVQAQLTTPDFTAPGATDPVQFVDSGDRDLDVQLVEVQPGTRSGTGFDFVPLQP